MTYFKTSATNAHKKNWICRCGRKNENDQTFCAFCREPKPESKTKIIRRTLKPGDKIPQAKSLKTLENALDYVFNKFIRQRDTLKGNTFQCISCRKFKDVRHMHAGHFHSAGHHKALRWDEHNVNGQCDHCNTFLHGNLLAYRKGLLKKYGAKIVDGLELRKRNRSKMMRFEVALLIDLYKAKLNEISK